MSITLHRELGMNPHLCVCERCGAEVNSLALIGNRTKILDCNFCHARIFGHTKHETCPNCGHKTFSDAGEIGEHDKIPMGLCDGCKAEVAEHAKIVADGGVYWKCAECHKSGVIKPSAFSESVRKAHGIEAPAPCGVEFSKCEEHSPG